MLPHLLTHQVPCCMKNLFLLLYYSKAILPHLHAHQVLCHMNNLFLLLYYSKAILPHLHAHQVLCHMKNLFLLLYYSKAVQLCSSVNCSLTYILFRFSRSTATVCAGLFALTLTPSGVLLWPPGGAACLCCNGWLPEQPPGRVTKGCPSCSASSPTGPGWPELDTPQCK